MGSSVSTLETTSLSRLAVKDLLLPEAVVVGLALSSKKEVLQEIAHRAAVQVGKDEHTIFDVLWARERLGTTGVGQGIAIPHGRVPGLEAVQGYFVRLAEALPFEAIDDKPVDLIFLLLSPEDAGADHLHALAVVSRLLRDAKLCEQLRKAKDTAAVYALLTAA